MKPISADRVMGVMHVKQPACRHNGATSESVTTDYLPETRIGLIDLLRGTHPQFAGETATLLCRRLRAAALILSIVLAAAFLANCVFGTPTLWLPRLILVVATAACFAAMCRRHRFSSGQLRAIELVIFGAALAQLCVMLAVRVGEVTAEGDAPSVIAVHYATTFRHGFRLPKNLRSRIQRSPRAARFALSQRRP